MSASPRHRRVLIIGSLPLAAPWNGADKNLARALVTLDRGTDYVLQTGSDDVWPEQVVARRTGHPGAMPTFRERGRSALLLMQTTHKVDLVHVVASVRKSDPLPPRLLAAWSRVTHRPIVHTVPGTAVPMFDKALFPGAATVVFSTHTAERLERAGVPNVVRMFPPMDVDAVRPATDPEIVRRQFGLGPRPVLYPSHLDEGNGIREAIEALSRLPAELADVTLVIAARWRQNQDVNGEFESIQRHARSVGVAGRVRPLKHVPDLFALIAACEMTVLVPRELSGKMDLPLVVLESLALKRPVIITDQPPMNESLLGGGRAVPYGNVAALAAALQDLLTNEDLRRSLADTGRGRLVELADPVRMVEAYRNVYETVLMGAQGQA